MMSVHWARDKLSTRKFDVGVFTESGPNSDIDRARRSWAEADFSPYQCARLSRYNTVS